MFENYTSEQLERARVVCDAFGITLEELEEFDRADGYSAARQEVNEREAAFRRRLEKRLPQVAAEVTKHARVEFGLPEGVWFEWVAGDV